MIIEIFEIRSFGSELPTDVDAMIINLNKKRPDVMIKKLDVLNRDMMKTHKDILRMLKDHSIEILPLIKVNGKLVRPVDFEKIIMKYL